MWMVALDRPGCGIQEDIEAENREDAYDLFFKKHRQLADTCWCYELTKEELKDFRKVKYTSYPENPSQREPYYIEFRKEYNKPETFQLFKYTLICPEIGDQLGNVGHPYNLSLEGEVNVNDNVIQYNTKTFLKFMVDALNEKTINDEIDKLFKDRRRRIDEERKNKLL